MKKKKKKTEEELKEEEEEQIEEVKEKKEVKNSILDLAQIHEFTTEEVQKLKERFNKNEEDVLTDDELITLKVELVKLREDSDKKSEHLL